MLVRMQRWGPSFGPGFAGIGSMSSGIPPSSVLRPRRPLLMVVEPVTFTAVPLADVSSDAVHVAETPSAIAGPGPIPPGQNRGPACPGAVHLLPGGAGVMVAELVADA